MVEVEVEEGGLEDDVEVVVEVELGGLEVEVEDVVVVEDVVLVGGLEVDVGDVVATVVGTILQGLAHKVSYRAQRRRYSAMLTCTGGTTRYMPYNRHQACMSCLRLWAKSQHSQSGSGEVEVYVLQLFPPHWPQRGEAAWVRAGSSSTSAEREVALNIFALG